MSANKQLAESIKLSDLEVSTIDVLHEIRKSTYKLMESDNKSNPELLPIYSEICKNVEFALQELWGFGANANLHRFWKQPHCLCPRLDNEESYGSINSCINEFCPVHGKIIN